jgi:hypothetical protein
LLHNNTVPHTAAATVETVRKSKFNLLPYPAYSSDFSPSDYYILGMLRDALRGRRFSNDEEVKDAVHTWLREQPKTFFADGIRRLVD